MALVARNTNSCSALAPTDFDELVAIANQYAEARGFIVWLLDKASKLVTPPGRCRKGYRRGPGTSAQAQQLGGFEIARFDGRGHDAGQSVGAHARQVGQSDRRRGVRGLAGLGGAPAAVSEITFTTTLILRQIQAIARSYGEDLEDPQTRIECMSVLALGGPGQDDDQLDDGFWLTRAALFNGITEKTVGKGVEKAVGSETGKLLLGLDPVQKFLPSEGFKKLLERFGVTTQAAFAAKLAPVLSVASGAYVNYSFMAYYQDVAHVHYRLKRLERAYDRDQIRSCFVNIRTEPAKPKMTVGDAAG